MDKKVISTVGVVLLVAVVGVILFLVQKSKGEMVVGEAVKTKDVCVAGNRCGFITKEKFDISCKQYANENWLGEINGNMYCKQQGAQFCSQGFWIVQNKNGPDSITPFSCGQMLTGATGDFDYTKYNSYPNFEVEDVLTVYTCCNVK